jgi:trk system potassium uptake protein TrkA
MNILIMGAGRVGAQLADILWKDKHDIVVMDTESENFLLLPKELREMEGSTVLGDGALDEDLIKAGIEKTEVFIAVDRKDNKNALASQKALHIFKVRQVICRIGDPNKQEVYIQPGLTTISSTSLTADMIFESVNG